MRQRYTYPGHDEMVGALLEYWERAVEAGVVPEGRAWYPRERQWVWRMSAETRHGPATVAGVATALSPQVDWNVAKRISESALSTGEPGEGCLRESWSKAARIIDGARPLTVLGGRKSRAFYRALRGDDRQAVVDTWMLRAVDFPSPWGPTPAQYDRVADALRYCAEYVGETVAAFQATVWIEVRGRG